MRTLAIVNQKGGCGKTTTAVNLAGALAADGHRVLVVDMDPQAHATLALGFDPEALDENLYEVLAEPVGSPAAGRLSDVLQRWSEGLHLAPSGIVLSALEQKLTAERAERRTERLEAALATVHQDYDYAVIDCPPNVGVLTFNALRAAQEVIVPLEPSDFAIHGVQKLLETVALLSDRIGSDLSVRILPTLYDGRTRYARDTLAEIRELFGNLCFDTVIRSNVKLREAARRGQPICSFARKANGTLDYAALALELSLAPPAELAADATANAALVGGDREIAMRYRDPGATDVRIAGDFNGWVPDKDVQSLVQAEGSERVWTKLLNLPPGTYHYRYVVDGEWREDPDNPNAVPGPVGGRNSVLVVR
jgi:chromosome partitioning protein